MNAYDEKLYEFLTRQENFESFTELYKHFEKVKERLVEDFWKAVEQELLKKSLPAEWTLWLDEDNLAFFHNEYYRTRDDSASFIVSYYNLYSEAYCGLWISTEANVQEIELNTIYVEISKDHPNWEAGKKNDTWVAYEYTGDDFRKIDSLMKILPDTRQQKVEEYANMLMSALEELGPVGMKFAKKLK